MYGCLDASWHWYRYEWQARGSIHAHGCAQLKNDPGLCDLITKAAKGWEAQNMLSDPNANREELLATIAEGNQAKATAVEFADRTSMTGQHQIHNHPLFPSEMWKMRMRITINWSTLSSGIPVVMQPTAFVGRKQEKSLAVGLAIPKS